MFASLSSAWMLRLKKYGYWIWLIAVLGIPLRDGAGRPREDNCQTI